TFLAEDTRFTLHFTDAGESVEVGLPVALPDLDFYALGISAVWAGWVAMDGSVYDGNSFNPRFVDMQGHPGRSGFDQDADFAMGYDTAGGSGLALSQSEGLGIGSPLVDAGSRDLLNDGFTSPHRTGGIFDEPDNPVAALDFMGSLDAGYHHFGRPRFPRQTVTQVGVPVYEWVTRNIPPFVSTVPEWDAINSSGQFATQVGIEIDSNREIDIASGHFGQSATEDNFGEDFTVAVFPTAQYHVGPRSSTNPDPARGFAVAALPFRGTTGNTSEQVSPAYVGIIAESSLQAAIPPYTPGEIGMSLSSREVYTFYPYDCRAVAACSVPNRGPGDSAGTVYVAAVARFSSDEEVESEYRLDRVYLWRVRTDTVSGPLFPDDDDPDTGAPWPEQEVAPGGLGVLLGATRPPYLIESERTEILDVTVCANNDDSEPGVYVSWIERRGGVVRLQCQFVPENPGNPVTLGWSWDASGTAITNHAFVVDGNTALPDHFQIAFDEVEQLISPAFQESVPYRNSIESDYDFDEEGAGPRLVYFDFDGTSNEYGTTTPIGPRQALLGIDDTSLRPISVIGDGEDNFWYAKGSGSSIVPAFSDSLTANQMFGALAVNHAGPLGGIRAFSSYNLRIQTGGSQVYDLWLQGLSQDGSGHDDWQSRSAGITLSRPGAPAVGNLHYPDVTYRFSGTPRAISAQSLAGGRAVTTNLERAEDLYSGSEALATGLYPHLTTNAVNLTDNFLCFVTGFGASQEVTVIQVDP
ncbi:MAG: hypothetical protein HUU25_14225, partial [Candidatus Sumerlaeia bacterium]|nr:hypothetical protein [Candidatus Sumerlaeia bacterium]